MGVMLATLLASLDQTIVSTAMPRIITDLGGVSRYTWVTTAYIISSAVTIPITGKLTDMYGRKYFYITGIAVFIFASLLCGLSNTMTQIIIFRGVQGIGAGMMMSNAFTVIGDLFPPLQRGKYQGFIGAVWGVSALIGPLAGGFLTDTLSWHWVFFVNVPLGIPIIFVFFKYFPYFRPSDRPHKIDYGGIVTFILCVVPALFALSLGGNDYDWRSAPIIGLFSFSAVMFVLFLWFELRHEEPIIPLTLFRDRIISFSEIVVFITAFGMFGSIIFVPLFFQGVMGSSATASGSLLIPMTLSIVIGTVISGQLLSRAGGQYRAIGAFGIAIMAAGMFLLSGMTPQVDTGWAVSYMIMVGLGLGITMPLYTIVVQNAVPYYYLGAATSSIAFFRSIGGSVGLAIFGLVLINRFKEAFIANLSPAVESILGADKIASMASNPQALINPEAQSQLREFFLASGPDGLAAFNDLIVALQFSLSEAIAQIFWIGFIAVTCSLVLHFFIKQIPLRTQHDYGDLEPPTAAG